MPGTPTRSDEGPEGSAPIAGQDAGREAVDPQVAACGSEGVDELTAASVAYRTVATLLGPPRGDLLWPLRAAGPLEPLLDAVEALPQAGSVVDAARLVEGAWREAGIDSPSGLIEVFDRVFGHAQSPDFPPYETEYGVGARFRQSQRLAQIVGFYRAFGLEVDPDVRDRPDHIAVELEFVGYLLTREVHARLKGEADRADLCRRAQDRFLAEHLGPVIGVFANLMEERGPRGVHSALARLAAALVAWDLGRRGLTVTPAGGPDMADALADDGPPIEEGEGDL